MEKYGFVYLWFDSYQKMFYVGRHWGTIEDGYLCSSNRMRDAYRRRPKDFKRRIIKKVDSKEQLVLEEQRYLDMIKPEECNTRYYNTTLKASTPSMRGRKHSDETKKKIGKGNKGKIRTEEHKDKWRQANLKQFQDPAQRLSRSIKIKALWNDPKYREHQVSMKLGKKKAQAKASQ